MHGRRKTPCVFINNPKEDCGAQGRGSGVNFALPADLVVDIVPKLIVFKNASGKGLG